MVLFTKSIVIITLLNEAVKPHFSQEKENKIKDQNCVCMFLLFTCDDIFISEHGAFY